MTIMCFSYSALVALLLLATWLQTGSAFTIRSPCLVPRTTTTTTPPRTVLQLSSSTDDAPSPKILCELQTFLRLLNLDEIPTGGSAKVLIQAGEVLLNGQVETRRAKKLYAGDKVQLEGFDQSFDVAALVAMRGYVYKPKSSKKK